MASMVRGENRSMIRIRSQQRRFAKKMFENAIPEIFSSGSATEGTTIEAGGVEFACRRTGDQDHDISAQPPGSFHIKAIVQARSDATTRNEQNTDQTST